MFRRTQFAIAVFAGLVIGGAAQANSIGVDFTTDNGFFEAGTHPMAPGDLAGVVAQVNWNNTQPQGAGTTANIQGGGVLRENTGAATGVTITWTGGNEVVMPGGAPNNADSNLYKDYLESASVPGVPITVTMGNIAYSKYDVIVYVGDFIGSTCCVSVSTLNLTDSVFYDNMNNVPFSGYVRATGTNAGNANLANYVEFDDVVGASFRLDVSMVTGNRGAIAAIQIVDASAPVPEPATLGLLGAGLAAFGVARRRKSA